MHANVTGSVRIMHKSATHPAAYRTVAAARGNSASTSEYASAISPSSHNECTSIQPSLWPQSEVSTATIALMMVPLPARREVCGFGPVPRRTLAPTQALVAPGYRWNRRKPDEPSHATSNAEPYPASKRHERLAAAPIRRDE